MVTSILGVIYYAVPIYNLLWDVFGVILMITWCWNFVVLFLNDKFLEKSSETGKKIHRLNYNSLIFYIMAMLMLVVYNLGASAIPVTGIIMELVGYALSYIGFFGLCTFGLVIACLDVINIDNEEAWRFGIKEIRQIKQISSPEGFKKVLKTLLKLLCILTLAHGVVFTVAIYFGWTNIILGGIYGIFVSMSSGFLIFIYLATTLLLLKLINQNIKKNYNFVLILGLTITGFTAFPLLLTPCSIQNAETQFSTQYGVTWRDSIPDDVEAQMLQTPFTLPQYFLGIPNKECIVKENIRFYTGTSGVDSGITLNFDAYLPKDNDGPGQNSTLIRIHGGGWTMGDKGVGNMPSVSKYLAAQGYCVFDIQYGLADHIDIGPIDFDIDLSFLQLWNHKQGNFTLSDQIRHIGLFTKYLADNNGIFQANLKSTFVSGGSAGGHLSSMTAFGWNNPYFAGNFSDEIELKGAIPIYPADDTTFYFHFAFDNVIPGTPETNPVGYTQFMPSKNINPGDPPALIFIGTSDGLAPPYNSETIHNALLRAGQKSVILYMPLAGHANDLLFSSNYGQVFLYYLERFLYLNR